VRLSYCVVNTNGRDFLLACLEAIERTHPGDVEHEILVLDNASDDGSVDAIRARRWATEPRIIALEERAGKAANDSRLLREAQGELCLLLNEDSELQTDATGALIGALEADSGAAVAGAQLLDPAGEPRACAWRLPTLGTILAGAFFLHRLVTVQSGEVQTRSVGWVQSSAMLVRHSAAEAVGYLDPDFFVYSDETDFCKRLGDAGWRSLYVPDARAIHHEQLATDQGAGDRRIVEFHRNRDLYMRKHHGRVAAAIARPLQAFPYLLRAFAALLRRGQSTRHYLAHARQALSPGRGEGIREAAVAFNRLRSDGASYERPARTR
jgi:N-acetylglucosaminyl-diphospho-decaprenol L-rhamnosyltransferase